MHSRDLELFIAVSFGFYFQITCKRLARLLTVLST